MRCEPGLEDTAPFLLGGATLQSSLAEISADLVDLPVPQHVTIQVIHDAEDLARYSPAGRGAPAYAIGVAYPDLGIVSIALRKNDGSVDPLPTLRHELGHLALGAAIGDRAPRWLHEGFAAQHAREWSWDRAETLAGMAVVRRPRPVRPSSSATSPTRRLPASHAYIESYDFAGF